ncbi:MAG: glutaredoxin family protein [Anaerolineae bacterium]
MFCEHVKEFLSQRGVEFTERNVAEDGAALAELEALGVMTTPVTVIGSEVVVGFNQDALEAILQRQ